jgi:hypothetical protein
MTETELNVIAALAMIGLNSSPVNGYSAPAAIGTPRALYTKAKKRLSFAKIQSGGKWLICRL